jgi:apolipoprotein D and lipocalin family protein
MKPLALVLASLALAACSNDPLDVAPNVDLQRFQGKWYEVAKLPRSTQSDCNATTQYFTMNASGGVDVRNECHLGSATGQLKSVAMAAKIDDPSVPAKLSLDVGGFYGDYWILEVGDHYEYAVVGTPSRSYLWILSRTPSLDPTAMKGVLDRASSKKFDVSRIEYTPQPQP